MRVLSRINSLLTDDGIGLLHFMGCTTDKNDPDPFVQTYIYPGSTHPQLSLALKGLERRSSRCSTSRTSRGTTCRPRGTGTIDSRSTSPSSIPRSRARFIRMFENLMAIYIAGCTALVSGVFQVLYTKNFRKNLPWHRL